MDCSVTGCLRPIFAKGICHPHYDEQRRAAMPLCEVDGCEDHQHAHGLCGKHYRARLRTLSEPCDVVGCERPQVANGLCDTHRKRQDRHGNLDPTRASDWGGKGSHPLYHRWGYYRRHDGIACEEWTKDFWVFVNCVGRPPSPRHQLKRLDLTKSFGPDNFCWIENVYIPTEGESVKDRNRRSQKQYREKDPERYRRYCFRKKYGVGPDRYNAMIKGQNGLCAICGNPETATNRVTGETINLAVDHDHETGKVRALLCKGCNTGLGSFRDDPELLIVAALYLEKHK